MRPSLVGVLLVAATVGAGGRASAADGDVAPVAAAPPVPAAPTEVTPYDHPAPPVAAPVPAAVDPEAPLRVAPLRLRPPLSGSAAQPAGSDAGLIAGEVFLGLLTTTFTGVLAVGTVAVVPAVGLPLLLLAPAATGGVVCGVGRQSAVTTGRCGSAIGGAYLGALLTIPTAYLFSLGASGSNDDEGALAAFVGGAVIGFVVGTTVGAVIGWNVASEPKGDATAVASADPAAARQALADASERASWTEPLRRRGAEPAARLTLPLLALRF